MKFIKIFKGLTGIAFLFSSVFAEKQKDCTDIKNYLKDKQYADKIIDKCVEDDNGQVTTLTFKNIFSSLTKDDINKLTSYKTLQVLEYNHGQKYYFTEEDTTDIEYNEYSNIINLGGYPEMDNVPETTVPNFILDELSDLSELRIINYGYYIHDHFYVKTREVKFGKISSNNQFKLPKSLKKLYLEGIKLNQEYIDTISGLTNLEEIHFNTCNLSEVDLKSLKVPNIVIEDDTGAYGWLTENTLSKFINAKHLTVKNIEIENYILKEIGELTNLEELNFVKCIDYDYYSRVGNAHGCLYDGNGCFEINRYELKWEYLKDLTKLNTLTINRNMDVPTWVKREYLNNMKNLKNFEINGSKPSLSELYDCKDIANYLESKDQVTENAVECVENKEGQVTSLKITDIYSEYTSDIQMLRRLLSYPTINSLVMKDIDVKEEDIQSLIKDLKYLNEL